MRKFAFDPAKSAANIQQHGIDILAAQALWDDASLLEIPARPRGEPRFLVIGRLHDKHWSAVITYGGATLRLISFRRSLPEEIRLYENF
ncbi:MAG: BrnT family toxin [Cyanobacteriota bacterium]